MSNADDGKLIIVEAKPMNIIQINDSVRNPLFGYRQILTRECSRCGKKREYLANSGERHFQPFQMEICHECQGIPDPIPAKDKVTGPSLTIEEIASRAVARMSVISADATAEELTEEFISKLAPEEIDILTAGSAPGDIGKAASQEDKDDKSFNPGPL